MTDTRDRSGMDDEAVSENPEWTEKTQKRSMPFDQACPDVARRLRGPQKTPTRRQITLRLDQRVIDHFKASGDGWQRRMNEALLKAAGL